jgi:hypothetical protein
MQMPANRHRLGAPAPQRFGAMKEKHSARPRCRIRVIAKQDLTAGRDIFEAHLPLTANQVLGHASHVARGLIRKARKGCAFRFRLDHPAQSTADEERIIDRTGGGGELAHSDTEARAEVHVLARLHEPTGVGQLAVDRHPCAVFGVENVLPHDGVCKTGTCSN